MDIVNIVILALSGLLLIFVGASRLGNPIATYAKSSGITLPNDTDLLNEMRGVGAVMLLGGITVLLGIFVLPLTFSSHLIGVLLFLGFAGGRFFSMRTDGKPNQQIRQGIIFELVLGGANLFALMMGS